MKRPLAPSTWTRSLVGLALTAAAAACGGAAEPTAATPRSAPPAADRGPGPAPQPHARPAQERVARAVERVPESEAPAPLWCDDPAFLGGDLVIGGERVRLPSTCFPLERAMSEAERPERR